MDSDRTQPVVRYGVWDRAFNDLILIPHKTDGYQHSTVQKIEDLSWCPDDEIVKVTIEYVKKSQ